VIFTRKIGQKDQIVTFINFINQSY